jgi:triosephosphate isomerase
MPMKSKRLIVGNWKMNPESPESARAIFLAVRRAAEKIKRTEVLICPPAIYFTGLAKLATPKVKLGTQNIFWESAGPFTGEMSAAMVQAAGGKYTLIGHSERRAMGETPEMINKKVIAATSSNLGTILCIGEKERDAQGNYLSFIKDQLATALAGVQKKFVSNLVIAYEPVWAIGKTEAMKGADMHEMLLYIRKVLTELLGQEYAKTIPVLYGGSVTPLNAEDIIGNGHVDGMLVGRQSLEPLQFKEILTIVDKIS